MSLLRALNKELSLNLSMDVKHVLLTVISNNSLSVHILKTYESQFLLRFRLNVIFHEYIIMNSLGANFASGALWHIIVFKFQHFWGQKLIVVHNPKLNPKNRGATISA